MTSNLNVAIVGSTGAVGVELLRVLERRKFSLGKLSLLASKRSMGKQQRFHKKEYTVQELNEDSFKQDKIDVVFFSAGGSISRKFAPLSVEAGAVAVDNSSAFRMQPHIPLVIPEVNPQEIRRHQGLIANPNCSTIIMLMAITPIHRINPIKKVVVSTYQAASGAGMAAMQELEQQGKEYLAGREPKPQIFAHPIAFNAFSHDSAVDMESGYNEEELKMIQESHKILGDPSISITATCIRIPVFRAHSESIHLELSHEADLAAITKALREFPGLKLINDRSKNYFPMPLEASGQDEVLVGRLRQAPSQPNTVELWCCGDQLLKGAALNAVQIAEKLFG